MELSMGRNTKIALSNLFKRYFHPVYVEMTLKGCWMIGRQTIVIQSMSSKWSPPVMQALTFLFIFLTHYAVYPLLHFVFYLI